MIVESISVWISLFIALSWALLFVFAFASFFILLLASVCWFFIDLFCCFRLFLVSRVVGAGFSCCHLVMRISALLFWNGARGVESANRRRECDVGSATELAYPFAYFDPLVSIEPARGRASSSLLPPCACFPGSVCLALRGCLPGSHCSPGFLLGV